MTYQEIAKFLVRGGFEKLDEAHGNMIPHYYKFGLSLNNWDYIKTVEIICESNKNGEPGKVVKFRWEA